MEFNLNNLNQKEILHMIVDELEGVILVDENGRYVYANNRWCSITGYTLDEVKGKLVRDIVHSSLVDYTLATKRFTTGDATLINKKTGQHVPVYCSYTPIFKNEQLKGCFVYMIPKSETESMDIPTGALKLIEYMEEFFNPVNRGIGTAKYSLENIIGNSLCMRRLKEDVVKGARSGSTVLIQGETGTGKELIAHAIHGLSSRSNCPFVKVNCSAIPQELMESEFFGYESGAFTGARKGGKIGKFEKASGGSLFLDEISQLPMHIQPKFLRVLQEHEVDRIGSTVSVPIDTRMIAASNIPLSKAVENGTFREDLFYRLHVFTITVPPLRERREDIQDISYHVLMKLNQKMHTTIPYIEGEAMEKLIEYDWPGNVRELQNVIERAMNLSWTEPLSWEHFAGYFEENHYYDKTPGFTPVNLTEFSPQKEAEITELNRVLEESKWNKSEAARMLGISRTALYKRMKKYNIMD